MPEARIYYARHMTAGLCGYDDETILVDTDALKSMIPSFVGMPVYIAHRNAEQRAVDTPDGYVSESFFNEFDSFAWVKILVTTPEGIASTGPGWGVSNGYLPSRWAPGGTKNNVPYDREMLAGEFNHLALVKDPRYEDAKLFTPDEFKAYQAAQKTLHEQIHNSKTTPPKKTGANKMNLFKTKREPVTEIDDDTEMEVGGKVMTVKEFMNSTKTVEQTKDAEIARLKKELANAKAKKNDKDEDDKDEKKNDLDGITLDDVVTIGGKEIRLGDALEYFGKMKPDGITNKKGEKKNAEGDDGETEEEKAARIKKDAEDIEKAEKEEKENALNKKKNFDELHNANKQSKTETERYETKGDQTARGAERYGKKK